MKNIFKYSMLGLSIVAMSSCIDTLDTHPTTVFDAPTVWGSKATVEAFVYGTYNSVITNGYAGSGQSTSWEARTPNSIKCSQVGEGIDAFTHESNISIDSDFGCDRFSLLRKVNLIITNVEASETLTEAEKLELSAHGYMMRGMIFFDQARKMGRFVPVREVFSVENPEAVNLPMTKTVAESYEIVISDLKKAADNLPVDNLTGLPTRYAAGVLLSRAALQAYAYTKDSQYLDIAIEYAKDVIDNSGASLLENLSPSNSLWNETQPLHSENLWAYYREKQNTVIKDFDELVRTYPNISADNVKNSKSPVALKNERGQTFESWAIYFPTQDLVDQFLVVDEESGKALPWYETSQYTDNVDILDPNSITEIGQVDAYRQISAEEDEKPNRNVPSAQDFNQVNDKFDNFARYHKLKADNDGRDISDLMYQGRDKRFYTFIIHDKATWLQGEYIETNLGGNMSQGVRDKEDGGWYNTVTGYYWRKGNSETTDPVALWSTKMSVHFCITRLGEAYLNLAEAYLCKGASYVNQAVAALNETRTKHGGLPKSTATTLEDAWADYIRERNCEMCHEGGDIYYSYLRWGMYGGPANHGRKAGEVVYDLDRPVYKMQMDRARTQVLIGQATLLNSAQRKFNTSRYILPINRGFLDTRKNYGIIDEQNQGW